MRQRNLAAACFIQLQRRGRLLFQTGHVQPKAHCGNLPHRLLRGLLEKILFAGQKRLIGHPYNIRLKA